MMSGESLRVMTVFVASLIRMVRMGAASSLP